jgi:Fur family ferric uptake transcriptional regulator
VTGAPEVPRLDVETPEQAMAALRGSGLRISTPRRLLVEALFASPGPVSAGELAESLALEESSVYRNLELLERHGLIRHVHLAHGPGLYALAGRDHGEYLYCERCGATTVVAAEELEPVRDYLRARFGHHARFGHFAIVGRCRDCAAARPQ